MNDAPTPNRPPHQIPKAVNGFVQTLNQMGFMTTGLDPYSQAWVDFSAQQAKILDLPALEIGAAYGVATLSALNRGAVVIANDLDPRHLALLCEQAPPKQQARLIGIAGAFPQSLRLLPKSISAILMARVIHFFDAETITIAAQQLFNFLTPGGKVFITAETPYLGNLKAFIPLYESRLTNHEPWPGWLEDMSILEGQHKAALPSQMHFMDPTVLRRVFEGTGFTIEQCDFFPRPEFPPDLQRDGRESVGLIAVRPQ